MRAKSAWSASGAVRRKKQKNEEGENLWGLNFLLKTKMVISYFLGWRKSIQGCRKKQHSVIVFGLEKVQLDPI